MTCTAVVTARYPARVPLHEHDDYCDAQCYSSSLSTILSPDGVAPCWCATAGDMHK